MKGELAADFIRHLYRLDLFLGLLDLDMTPALFHTARSKHFTDLNDSLSVCMHDSLNCCLKQDIRCTEIHKMGYGIGTDREQVGATFGLLAHWCRGVGRLRHVDA